MDERDESMLGISSSTATTVAATVAAGGLLVAAGRYAPVEGQWQNGSPAGGAFEQRDVAPVVVFAALGALGGAFGTLVGAHAANHPSPPSMKLMLAGAAIGATLLGSTFVGIGLRD